MVSGAGYAFILLWGRGKGKGFCSVVPAKAGIQVLEFGFRLVRPNASGGQGGRNDTIVVMKILITTGIFPPDVGGPATQIEYLAADLVKAGIGVDVLTYGAPEKKTRNFKVYAVSRSWPAPFKQILFGLKTFFLARKTDVIYTMDLYSPGYYSMLAAKFWRKKFVVRFAGDSAWEMAQNSGFTQDNILIFQDKVYGPEVEKRKKQRAKILKSTDIVIAVSNFMRDLAVKIGVDASKVKVIYNAIDILPEPSQWQRPNVPTLVYAGRLTPWKGVEMLIRAVAKLKPKYPNVVFEVLGDGSEEPNLKLQASSLKLRDNVRFRGRVSEEESHKIFSRSTVFVLNTNYEGLPHSVLNAMRVGVPVITTPVGGNLEVVKDGENGLLAPYNDELAWTAAIDNLLGDTALQEKFSENGKKTLERFRWSELINKTIRVFKQLI